MNINQVKGLSWVLSAVITAGLGYYVFDFLTRQRPAIEALPFTEVDAKKILDGAVVPDGPKVSLLDSKAVERAFYKLNWTGKAPPKPVERVAEPDEGVKSAYRPMVELVKIQLLMVDERHPEHGRAYISYTAESGVVADAKDPFLREVRVGEKLDQPLDYATVKSITQAEGLTFVFDDSERPEESINAEAYDPLTEIYVVAKGEKPLELPKFAVPKVNTEVWRPQTTIQIEQNVFMIGTDDSTMFGEDYGGILAREVRHARHRDPKTGKYDGIELKEVKAGGRVAAHGGQTGDIIKSINGHSVTSPAEAITFVKNNQDKYTKWEVVIENKGKTRTMTYNSPPE